MLLTREWRGRVVEVELNLPRLPRPRFYEDADGRGWALWGRDVPIVSFFFGRGGGG